MSKEEQYRKALEDIADQEEVLSSGITMSIVRDALADFNVTFREIAAFKKFATNLPDSTRSIEGLGMIDARLSTLQSLLCDCVEAVESFRKEHEC